MRSSYVGISGHLPFLLVRIKRQQYNIKGRTEPEHGNLNACDSNARGCFMKRSYTPEKAGAKRDCRSCAACRTALCIDKPARWPAEVSTAAFYRRNVNILVLDNDAFGEVKFEQRELGDPEYGTTIGHIAFALSSPLERMAFGLLPWSNYGPPWNCGWPARTLPVLDVQVDPEEEAVTPDKVVA